MANYISGGSGKRQHVKIVEAVLGKELPSEARVHHIDGNGRNNVLTNLLVCPSETYHQLIHLRQRAFDESGNPTFRKCPFCKQWSDPKEMIVVGDVPKRNKRYCHRKCKSDYERNRKAKANG